MVHKLIPFNWLMRLRIPSMYDHVVSMLVQFQLHINPPIKITGSFEDPWFRSLRTHNFFGWKTTNTSLNLHSTCQFHCNNTLKHMNSENHAFPPGMNIFSESVMPSPLLWINPELEKRHRVLLWKPNYFWCLMGRNKHETYLRRLRYHIIIKFPFRSSSK